MAQPNLVLGEEIRLTRKMRVQSRNKEIREMQEASGSMSDKVGRRRGGGGGGGGAKRGGPAAAQPTFSGYPTPRMHNG